MTDGLELVILRPVQYGRECPTWIHVTRALYSANFYVKTMSSVSTKPNPKFDDEAEILSERWLISYSDLVTTLMVLFIALYAMQLAQRREMETKSLTLAPLEKRSASAANVQAPRTAALEQVQASRKELISALKAMRDKQENSCDRKCARRRDRNQCKNTLSLGRGPSDAGFKRSAGSGGDGAQRTFGTTDPGGRTH
jgi:flagellar motor protein MotB